MCMVPGFVVEPHYMRLVLAHLQASCWQCKKAVHAVRQMFTYSKIYASTDAHCDRPYKTHDFMLGQPIGQLAQNEMNVNSEGVPNEWSYHTQ